MRTSNMRSGKQRRRTQAWRLALVTLLCLALLPLGTFAEEMPKGSAEAAQETPAAQEAPAAQAAEDAPAPSYSGSRKAKSFSWWSGSKATFKVNVLRDAPLDKSATPKRSWATGKKKAVQLFWSAPADKTGIDGFILLRADGKSKNYKQIAKVSKNATSYLDKKASAKDRKYAYRVVSYQKVGDCIRISPASSWCSAVTTKSKKKNGYKAALNKKSLSLQTGQTQQLKLSYKKPKKIHMGKNFRWSSDDPAVAKVDKKGKVTAVAPGSTKIRGRLASGRDMVCSVKVVAAHTPAAPKLERDYSTDSSIILKWNKVSYATSYDFYYSEDEGESFTKLSLTGTSYTHSGLTSGTLYTYYVVARNDNRGTTVLSSPSDMLKLKAVPTPRKTTISGFPTKAKKKARTTYSIKVTILAPAGRTAKLQMYENKKWVTKKNIPLPSGMGSASVKITFPKNWWYKKTSWRLSIPASDKATAATSRTLKITPTRYYQNPKGYVQIKNKISTHGYNYYTAPVLTNNASTRKEHVEAMIATAYKYLGDPYVVCRSGAPGKGLDCSGIVMQACYGAGVDLWPSNPYRHRLPAYEYESRNIAKMDNLKTVPYSQRKRGDLIFYANKDGIVIHVAIYLGNNKIIHSRFGGVQITGMKYEYGHICKVKRVFL